MNIIHAVLTAFVLFATPTIAQPLDIKQVHEQMLQPAVQIQYGNSTGSGTVVYSAAGPDGEVKTYVITNHHVIADAIKLVEEYDNEKLQQVKRQKFETVTVRFHTYADGSRYTGSNNRLAQIVAHDPRADLAVLILEDNVNKVEHVATVSAPNARLDRGERVYAVGAGLGNPPFTTEGIIGYVGYRIDSHPYIMATAPIIFGNSGGALYRLNANNQYELVGIPSRVAVQGGFFSSSAVSHIGWHIQMSTVRAFLERYKLSYILEK